MNDFLEESKEVANHFIKNILFVDDQIKWDEETDIHDLNARTLIHEFAKKGKSCTFYNVETKYATTDEDVIMNIVPNSDVIILDWKMKHELVGQENLSSEVDLEEDVPEEESRGRFTLQLLNKLVSKYKNSLKLILILTGEQDGNAILDTIHNDELIKEFDKNEDTLSLTQEKIKISIYFKPTLNGNHLPNEVKNKILENYGALPDIIDTEFASFTGGLISNTALKAISVIRDNASKLLKVYGKELDPAYLAHRALLKTAKNSEDLLKDTILHSISNLVSTSHISDKCDIGSIDKWLNQDFKTNQISLSSRYITLSQPKRKKIIETDFEDNFESTITELWNEEGHNTLSNNAINNYKKKLQKNEINYIDFFTPIDNETLNLNEEFAILSHHKEYFDIDYQPRLTLGTVIKDSSNNYFICVQPICDTVRIDANNNNFLFVPLKENSKPELTKIIVKKDDGEYLKLMPKYKANSVLILRFELTEDKDIIMASNNKFIEVNGQEYEWVLDLKDNHAQRIANEFGAYVSRVGLDEPEWLRRS